MKKATGGNRDKHTLTDGHVRRERKRGGVCAGGLGCVGRG